MITCDEIIETEETKAIPKNIICETKSFYILLAFLSITIALLIAFSVYIFQIKYKVKQKYLLPYYITSDNLITLFKEINIKNCTCFYLDDIIKIKDFNLDNILIDEKSSENISVYNISYKNLIQ